MELQGSGWYVMLSSGTITTRYTNDHTPVCTFFNNLHLMHEITVRHITKYLASTSTYVDLPEGNWRLTARGVFYRPDIETVFEC